MHKICFLLKFNASDIYRYNIYLKRRDNIYPIFQRSPSSLDEIFLPLGVWDSSQGICRTLYVETRIYRGRKWSFSYCKGSPVRTLIYQKCRDSIHPLFFSPEGFKNTKKFNIKNHKIKKKL